MAELLYIIIIYIIYTLGGRTSSRCSTTSSSRSGKSRLTLSPTPPSTSSSTRCTDTCIDMSTDTRSACATYHRRALVKAVILRYHHVPVRNVVGDADGEPWTCPHMLVDAGRWWGSTVSTTRVCRTKEQSSAPLANQVGHNPTS